VKTNFVEGIKLNVSGLSFRQFHEGRIKFRPTFKYDIDENADVFDTSVKNRSPSYTVSPPEFL